MNDVLPDEIGRWHHVEQAFARAMGLHAFREVRTPLVEPTALFVRAVGETTDIVEKEMYSFEHNAEPLTLRPEGTAGAARAYVEHAVHAREPVTRWWYAGPMFRAERPQRGRYRQFYQLGAEIFGDAGPGTDAEVIGGGGQSLMSHHGAWEVALQRAVKAAWDPDDLLNPGKVIG